MSSDTRVLPDGTVVSVDEFDARNAPKGNGIPGWADISGLYEQQQKEEAAKQAGAQGSFFQDLGNKIAGNMKPPGLDTGLFDSAMGYSNQAQQQNADDMVRYKQLMNGQGSLGAQQAMAGAQQAAMAQRAMANSARGGLYGQAALGQNATNLNNTANLQAMQQANAIREADKYAGASMYSNAANMGRNVSNAQAGAAQSMGLLQGQQNLGYQGIADNFIQNMDKIGAGVDASNATQQGALSQEYQKKLLEDRRRQLENQAAKKDIAFGAVKTAGDIIGKFLGGK